jgi:small GTP-binding protein
MTESSIDQSYQLSRQKIIFCGDAGVGKTSIINSLMGQKFSEEYEPSIGVDFFSKTIRYKGRLIKLQIWDSAGQEKFKSLIPNYIRGSCLIFLIFDVSQKTTYDHLNDWIKFINNIENSGIIIVVGNKIDLDDRREVNNDDGEKFCKENNYEYFEVSAKDGTNIDNMLYSSLAGLPVFNTLNGENIPKENIIKDLLQENLDSFRAQSFENGNNGNNNIDNNNNISDINNIDKINNNGLLNPDKNKKKRKCLC